MSLQSWWDGLAPSRAAYLVAPNGGLTRAELAKLVGHVCARFDKMGLAAGDRIVICTQDDAAAILAFTAALFDGIVPVMLAADTPAERAAAIAAQVSAQAAVVDHARAEETWLATLPHCVTLAPNVARKSWFSGRNRLAEQLYLALGLQADSRIPRLPDAPDALAYILFTSGTTSQPSGVMITRGNLLANVATIARVLQIGAGSRIFNDMVLAHADGMVQGPVMAIAAHATVIRAGGFAVDRIEDWLDTAKREGATHFLTVPTVWALIDRYARHDDYFAHDSFVGLGSVAAGLDAGLWARIEARFGRPLTNQYGLTETVASAVYAGPAAGAGARFSIGRPIDCQARIAPIDGLPDAGDGRGELQLRGDNIFAGYWNNPARTNDSFTPDGWFRTGDIARQDGLGDLHIVGRLKTIIMTGGFLIRPEEIDEAMSHCAGVTGSVTVARADDLFGEIAVTVVETTDPALDEAALMHHAARLLEQRKVPKHILPVASLPRGPAGKPRLDAVRALVEGHLAARLPSATADPSDDVEQAVLQVAARVFRVDAARLTLRSSPDSLKSWDSFQQVNLILALEDRFGITIPTGRAAAIRDLASALAAVRAGLAG